MVDEVLDSITREDVLQAVEDFCAGALHPFLTQVTEFRRSDKDLGAFWGVSLHYI
jgi:hypothetical protein